MSIQPVHYYHVWAGDRYHGSAWEVPAREHFAALEAAGFDGDVRIGLLGGLTERASAIRTLKELWPEADIVVQADEGFEQITIEVMHEWSKEAHPQTPVFYSHTKGAFQDCPMNTQWRQAMNGYLIDHWTEWALAIRRGSYDAIGLHWLTHEQYPEYIHPMKPMFGGNFWWARAGYLAQLERVTGTPEFPPINRWEAEGWVGQGGPKVMDLVPGWPNYG